MRNKYNYGVVYTTIYIQCFRTEGKFTYYHFLDKENEAQKV